MSEEPITQRFRLLSAISFSAAAALCGMGIVFVFEAFVIERSFSLFPFLVAPGLLLLGGAAAGFCSASRLASRAHAFNKRTAHRRRNGRLPWTERLNLAMQGFKYGAVIITLSFLAAGLIFVTLALVAALFSEPAYPGANTFGAEALFWALPISVIVSLPYALPALPIGGTVGLWLFAAEVGRSSHFAKDI